MIEEHPLLESLKAVHHSNIQVYDRRSHKGNLTWRHKWAILKNSTRGFNGVTQRIARQWRDGVTHHTIGFIIFNLAGNTVIYKFINGMAVKLWLIPISLDARDGVPVIRRKLFEGFSDLNSKSGDIIIETAIGGIHRRFNYDASNKVSL